MSIKSLDDLKKIREEARSKISLRKHGLEEKPYTEVLVGMATCGISAGARETLQALVKELANQNCDDVKVISVGCIGACHSEPTLQVNMPGKEPVYYGKITEDKVPRVVKEHLMGGEPIEEYQITLNIDRA